MNGHLAAIFTMMCCITLIDSIFLYITCNVLANVKYFYSIGCVLGILGVVTGPFGGQTANFAFDPLDKKNINLWLWPLLNIKGVVSKCHRGFLRREAVRYLKLGVLTADSRLAGGWKVIKSHIIRGFIMVYGELTAIHIHARLLWTTLGHLDGNVQLLCHKSQL